MSFRILGPLGVTVGEQSLGLGGLKQRAVLAALLVARGRVVSSESLARAAWNNDPPDGFSATLQVFIANLRKSFRDAGVDARSILVTTPPGYKLVFSVDDFDLARFERSCRVAKECAAEGRFADSGKHFRAALDEFTGEILADLPGLRFSEEFAAAVAEQRIEALSGWTDAEISCGRAGSVISELLGLTKRFPLREPLWVQLITALYLAGRQTDALEACRRLRGMLADELGIDPGRPIQDLEAKILRQETLRSDAGGVAMASTITDSFAGSISGQVRDTAGRAYAIPTRGLRIGRMPDNEVVLDSQKVSRYHAVIHGTESGFFVRDLRSANGTLLNGERVFDTTLLGGGDEIKVGPMTLTFEFTI